MSKIVIITKGKLLKGDKIEIEYTRKDSPLAEPAHCTEEHKNPPHPDLKNAFDALRVHAALLGEFIAAVMVPDIENFNEDLVKDFKVKGFTVVTDKNDREGVMLSAQKLLRSGKPLGFNTPVTRFDDESENAYEFMDDLIKCVDKCRSELKEYLLNSKYADDPQGKLDLKEQQ